MSTVYRRRHYSEEEERSFPIRKQTVSTKDDDNMDSDESDFEYEQSEEMNYFFISKYAAEE